MKAMIFLFVPDSKHLGHFLTGLSSCLVKGMMDHGFCSTERLTAGQHSLTLSPPTER